MELLFWNMNRRSLTEELFLLVDGTDTDILILAECQISDFEILESINRSTTRPFVVPLNPSQRLRFYTRFPQDLLTPIEDYAGVALRKLVPPIGKECLIAGVHLPSKLHRNSTDQLLSARQTVQMILRAEENLRHDRTIVLGDFNMNPFEEGLVAAEAFHSVMDRRTAVECQREVDRQSWKYFFNPMWSRLGDATIGPPGTYYDRRSHQVCYFWYTFDQVLIRPSLLDTFGNSDLEVVTSIGDKNLLDGNGRPDSEHYSDHLPIRVRLNIEKE
jgi:hypothetical protein